MLVEIKNLNKKFEGKKKMLGQKAADVKAVNNVSFSFESKQNIGLVGESGCGKTTLARLLIRLYQPDSGQIIFDGQDITKMGAKKLQPIRRHIQMVFQDPYSSLDPRFTVRQILREAIALDPSKYKTDPEKEQRMLNLLEEVNMPGDILNRYPHEFSGGERQRIAIARALSLNPKLLILDEAVSSLDVLVQDQILLLLENLQKTHDMTYLFISHNLKVVKRLCQTIAVMYKGKIIEMGPSEDVFSHPLHPYTRELLKAAIEFRSSGRTDDFVVADWGQLVERSNGHFVITG